MAQTKDIATKIQTGSALQPGQRLSALLDRVDIRKRFDDILGKKAPAFISSITSVANANDALKGCDPMSIISAAAIAAALDMPVNPSLGFAYIIPYKGKAQFQIGYKGFIQLAIRSGEYKTINATEVYEDEIKVWNPITAEIEFTDSKTWKQRDAGKKDKVVGYVAFFRLRGGFEKFIYMTKGQVNAHAKRYSQSFGKEYGPWKTHLDEMSVKTPLKLLLSKFGVLSIEMQKAVTYDQGVITETAQGETIEFPDNDAQEAQVVDPNEAGDAQEPV